MTSPWNGKIALITGASSGIGAAAAVKLAREGLHVWLVARRAERLSQVAAEIQHAGGRADWISADLTWPDERRRVFDRVGAAGELDILVNNAGAGWYGYYSAMTWSTADQIMQINMTAAAHLTHLFLPRMLQRHSGHIINVGSVAGTLPNQGIAIYGATKAFLFAFTTALHRELRGSGVHASILLPGPVSSEFYERAAGLPGGIPVPAERFAVSSERVADALWSVARRPRRATYVPGILGLSTVVDPFFGWLIDRIGPVLLKRATQKKPYN